MFRKFLIPFSMIASFLNSCGVEPENEEPQSINIDPCQLEENLPVSDEVKNELADATPASDLDSHIQEFSKFFDCSGTVVYRTGNGGGPKEKEDQK